MNQRRLLAGWSLFLALAGVAVAQESKQETAAVPSSSELARRIEEYVRPFADAGELSGTLLVARDEAVIYEKAFGMANYELGVANTPATLYCVASINKPMTQIVAIRLMEQGKLGPKDTLAKWIPDFPRGGEITVEHLLQHRAGIPHQVTSDAEETVPHTAADMVEFARRKELLFAPGSQSSYSSAGYSVLARVLELAAGRPFEDLLQDLVFAPAGAVHSAEARGRRLLPGRAASYIKELHGYSNSPLQDLSFLMGAGALFTTPRDLHLVMRALLAGTYGDGVRQGLLRDGKLAWNGITNGYRAFADHDAARKVTVIFAGNVFTGAIDLLRRDPPKIAAGEAVPPAKVPNIVPASVPPELRARYEGTYEIRPGTREELRFLDASQVEIGSRTLIAISEDSFFCPQDYATVRIAKGKDGAIEALEWEIPGGSLRFARVGPLGMAP
jgi:CubicO group peptidase (beta-lactamase class C family)